MRRAVAVLATVAVLALAGWVALAPHGGDHAASPTKGSRQQGAAGAVSPTTLPPGTVEVAHALAAKLPIYAASDGDGLAMTLANPIETGGPLVLMVTKDDGGARVQVDLPVRPNGSTGWVARSDVRLLTNPYRLEVDLGERTLHVFEHDREVLSSPVAVGAPATPTPPGHFFLTELLIQPNAGGAYGPFAYGLSSHSNVLTDFNGGSGQVGMHGTNDPSSIGKAVSHGCIRLPNEFIRRIRPLLPLGTPIDVRP
jgi:lipoprotein-anchoring transpeptidase ErfK/SrfK